MKNTITTANGGKYFVVFCDYNKHIVKLLKQAGGRWNPERKLWTIETAPLNGNFSLIRQIVKAADLHPTDAAAELIS